MRFQFEMASLFFKKLLLELYNQLIHPVAQSGNLFSEKVCKDILHLLWLLGSLALWVRCPFMKKESPAFSRLIQKLTASLS